MKTNHIIQKFLLILAGLLVLAAGAQAQTSFTSTSSTAAWGTSRWNNSSDATPYTSAFTANNTVNFTSGNYSFNTGMGSGNTINIGNVTVSSSVNVTFTGSIAGTYATGGAVRTINVGSGAVYDLGSQNISTASGTGFIKSGSGAFATGGSGYTGGFTLNAGTMIMRGINAMGNGNVTLNGGTVAANATRNVTARYTSFNIAGDVQFGEFAANVALASDTAALTFADNVALGAATRTLTLGNNGTQTFSGNISASAGVGLTFAANANTGSGSFVLSGNNTFSGGTTVNGGTVNANAVNALGGTSGVTINGGTLLLSSTNATKTTATLALGGGTLQMSSSAGVSDTLSSLTLSDNSTIDFGTISSGNNKLTLGFVSSWTSGKTLSIWNWTGTADTAGGTDQLLLSSTTGWAAQLANIKFYSGAGTGAFAGAAIVSGELVASAVPEPGTIAAGVALIGFIAYRERRRFRFLIQG